MTLPGIQFWHKQKLHASTPLWGLNYPAKNFRTISMADVYPQHESLITGEAGEAEEGETVL